MEQLTALKTTLFGALGHNGWHRLSYLGEADLLLPLGAVVALVLWRAGRRRDAMRFAGALGLCALTVGLLKLGIADFKWTVGSHTFNSKGFPSGHVAIATAFWGGLALLAPQRWAPLLLLPIPLVALTVLVLWWHHTLDIGAGLAIAAASLAAVRLTPRRRSPRSVS